MIIYTRLDLDMWWLKTFLKALHIIPTQRHSTNSDNDNDYDMVLIMIIIIVVNIIMIIMIMIIIIRIGQCASVIMGLGCVIKGLCLLSQSASTTMDLAPRTPSSSWA